MLEYTINITQNTATGKDQSDESTVYVAYWADNGEIFLFEDEKEEMDGVAKGYYKVAAKVKIIHPWLMAGTLKEIRCLFFNRAFKKVYEEGHIVENCYGTEFWKDFVSGNGHGRTK